ncbi:hypothetical protein CMK11_09880 [Candidatus Poribacteria bacterium]|nr:hypothetical protein [Candidatus Poribacteria bacterium]
MTARARPRLTRAVASLLLTSVWAAHVWALSPEAQRRYERGSEMAARHGQYRDALEDFRFVLGEDAAHAPAVVSAAQCHAALGELEPARELYTRALDLGLAPASVFTVRRELGKVGLRQGAFAYAQTQLQTARRLAEDDAEIAALLGDVYQKRGHPTRAIGEYTRALSLDPDVRAAHIGLASAHLEAGDAEDAVRHAQAAIGLDPLDPDAWYVAARALTKTGMRDEARAALASYSAMRAYARDVEAINESLAREPGNLGILQALADRHAQMGAVDAAIAAYERATGVDETRQAAYANIALLWLSRAEPGKAEEALCAASASGAEDATVHGAYGELYSARREWQNAAESYRAALSLEPSMPMAWVGLMRAAAMTGGRAPAEAVLDEWLAADPASSPAWSERGLLHYRDGEHDAAIEAIEGAVALDPANYEAANNLAWVYAETGRDLHRARELVDGVIASAPTPAAYDTLAYIEQQVGNLRAALVAIERATAMDPRNAEYRKRQDDLRRAIGQ